jgi:translin
LVDQLGIDKIIGEIDVVLKAKDEKRERVITHSREIIRRSGSAVLAVHKKDATAVRENLEAARAALEASLVICREQPEFVFTGPLPQAFQEFAEASVVQALIAKKKVPSPGELRVPVEPYITGLADAAGEMRRFALDSLRRDEFDEAERALETMEEIYTALKGLDYPRAVVPNLKRKVDVIRRLVEETRGDVTLAHQGRLIRRSIEGALKEKR